LPSLKEKVVASILAHCYSVHPKWEANSGTGFTEKRLADAIDRLRPFFTERPPVENPPKIPEKIQWVKPTLVCEVAFAEWTEDEQLRQTTFLGWRDDKSPEEVVLEKPV
jgi:bifunctional non-homologous end joining protein LigD